ncbi:MAG TPA: hypothetical protein DCF33_11165 [Saprospirales bacterium]|nr:hypothetical protein [Saprospirales bacterium]
MLPTLSIVFHSTARLWRIAGVVYLLQTGLAITLGMQIYGVLETSIGHSLELDRLMTGYDHTVITDFLKVHGASITPLIGQLRWLILMWMLFSVFLHAGLLYCTTLSDQPKISDYWIGGSKYFVPFLKISASFLVICLVWTTMVWLPVLLSLQWALEYFTSEVVTVWAVILLAIIYLSGLVLLYLWSISARIHVIRYGSKVGKGIREGWKTFVRHKYKILSAFLLFALTQTVLLLTYWNLDAVIGMHSIPGITFMFLLQQGFVYLRVLLQIGLYKSLNLRA